MSQVQKKQQIIEYSQDEDFFNDDLLEKLYSAESDSKEEVRLKRYEKTYGKEGAKVRNRIFKRILAKAQDGTKAGQWSARKAQSLTEDYEKAMSGKGKKPYKFLQTNKIAKISQKVGRPRLENQEW